MEKSTLTNFKIIPKKDIKGNHYYIIFDNNNQGGNNAYFCWKESVKLGWDSLDKAQEIKEIEIEWEPKEKGNKVINIYANSADEIFI